MFELTGLDFVQESTEPFVLKVCPSEKNVNQHGTLHGGVLFTICDEIVGRYVMFTGRQCVGVDANIHFFRPGIPNTNVYAKIMPRKVGKKLGTYLVDLCDESGKLLVDATFTVMFVD